MKHTLGILDEHVLIRKGLIEIINRYTIFNVIIEESDPLEFRRLLNCKRPEAVVVRDKFATSSYINYLKYNFPNILIILIINSSLESNKYIGIKSDSYLDENSGLKDLQTKLNKLVHEIEFNIGKNEFNNGSHLAEYEDDYIHSFTKRESEVMYLICEGFTNDEIARKIFLSKRTIESHRKSLLKKAGVKNTAELISWAFKNRVIII